MRGDAGARPHLTDTDRAYLDTLAAWCRGEAKTRAVSLAAVAVESVAVSSCRAPSRIAQHRRTQASIDARLRAVAALEGLDLSMLVEAWQRAFRAIQRADAETQRCPEVRRDDYLQSRCVLRPTARARLCR